MSVVVSVTAQSATHQLRNTVLKEPKIRNEQLWVYFEQDPLSFHFDILSGAFLVFSFRFQIVKGSLNNVIQALHRGCYCWMGQSETIFDNSKPASQCVRTGAQQHSVQLLISQVKGRCFKVIHSKRQREGGKWLQKN